VNKLQFRKKSDSIAWFADGQRLYAGSSYSVSVDAPEFSEDQESVATMGLYSGGVELATCQLVPDPLRRGRRVCTQFDVPAYAEDTLVGMRVELDGNTILLVSVTIVGAPYGTVGSDHTRSRWAVVDLGKISSAGISVGDMTQVKLEASMMQVPLSITPPSGAFDTYISITQAQEDQVARFPFTGVLVAGRTPLWSHQDSYLLPCRKWVLRVVRVADDYYADLRAGRPAGTELDPDGNAVVSAEVNV
jgi:hypothetical protein